MFRVEWDEPLWGFIHFIRQDYYVACSTWEDACNVASLIEKFGHDVNIRRVG